MVGGMGKVDALQVLKIQKQTLNFGGGSLGFTEENLGVAGNDVPSSRSFALGHCKEKLNCNGSHAESTTTTGRGMGSGGSGLGLGTTLGLHFLIILWWFWPWKQRRHWYQWQ